MRKTTSFSEITCPCTRTFSSMTTQMYFPRFVALRSEEALTSRVHFTLSSKLTKIKKIEQFGKNPQNYENAHGETLVFEQKPIQIDDFNEAEEKDVKERVEKRKLKKER